MKEIWKDIEGYEGLYQVSNYGNIKSLSRVVKNAYGIHRTEEKILKPQMKKKGYFQIQLSKDGKQKHYQVHRLVALAFVPNINNYPCINHKDENKINNKADNLEWCTYLYNNLYNNKEKRNYKKICQYNKNEKLINIFESINEASKKTNIKRYGISNCLNKRLKTSGGYIWKYYEIKKEEKKDEEEK